MNWFLNMIRKNRSNIILIIFLAFLYFTGLLSHVASFSQSLVVASGLVNADTDDTRSENFDFNFTIKDLQGSNQNFDQFKGKVVFLNLWATWCGPCRAEMPSIQSLYGQINHDKIAFVMLSIDREKDFDKVKKYVVDRSFSFPVFTHNGYLPEQLNVPSIPTTFVISAAGKIVMKEEGMRNYDTRKFKKYLEELSLK
jgi:thiol-disulfide isomerase/thioredoxin